MLIARGATPGQAAVTVIAVHGRDQDPEYMIANLVDPVVGRLPGGLADQVAWLVPGSADRTWYPGRYSDPLDDNQPMLNRSLARLDAAVQRVVAAGGGPAQIVWVGFSQGACLVVEYVLGHPGRWGGVAVLAGAVLGPPGETRVVDGYFHGTPFHFGVADQDPWMPAEAADEAARTVSAAGASVTVEVVAVEGHEIQPGEIEAVTAMITAAAGGRNMKTHDNQRRTPD